MRLTHWKKLSNPNYLGAYSIEDNKDLILTISKVQQETVTGPDGKKDECIVCYFSESEKPGLLDRRSFQGSHLHRDSYPGRIPEIA